MSSAVSSSYTNSLSTSRSSSSSLSHSSESRESYTGSGRKISLTDRAPVFHTGSKSAPVMENEKSFFESTLGLLSDGLQKNDTVHDAGKTQLSPLSSGTKPARTYEMTKPRTPHFFNGKKDNEWSTIKALMAIGGLAAIGAQIGVLVTK